MEPKGIAVRLAQNALGAAQRQPPKRPQNKLLAATSWFSVKGVQLIAPQEEKPTRNSKRDSVADADAFSNLVSPKTR